jgi:hypothetical protein
MMASVAPSPKRQELRRRPADAGLVGLDLLLVSSLRDSSLKEGSPILVVPPPISTIGLVPGLLQPAQHHDLHERARMQASRRGVEADIAGEGAPLIPVYHRALAAGLERPLALLNLGGVANITWIGRDEELVAFDTGPANALIDDWVRQESGTDFDAGGVLAATGRVDRGVLGAMLDHPFFDAPPPKSLDRGDFTIRPARGLSAADGAATLTAFTAHGVARGLALLPERPARLMVAGGGRHNATLMAMLADACGIAVRRWLGARSARRTTPADIAAAIGPGLAKAALAARVNGELRDLTRPLRRRRRARAGDRRDEADALELARHDYAHVLAEAVQALFPGTQITFGPATDDGFYYDVKAPDTREPFSMDDLPAIEEEMRRIIRADKPLRREVWSREQLIAKWAGRGRDLQGRMGQGTARGRGADGLLERATTGSTCAAGPTCPPPASSIPTPSS